MEHMRNFTSKKCDRPVLLGTHECNGLSSAPKALPTVDTVSSRANAKAQNILFCRFIDIDDHWIRRPGRLVSTYTFPILVQLSVA